MDANPNKKPVAIDNVWIKNFLLSIIILFPLLLAKLKYYST